MRKAILIVLFLALSHTVYAVEPAVVTLFVFNGGIPSPNEMVVVDGRRYRTDEAGSVRIALPPGGHTLSVEQAGGGMYDIDMATVARENVQVIVTLRDSGRPGVDIESSAGEKHVAKRKETVLETDAEPGSLEGRITSSEGGKPVAGARVFVSGSAANAVSEKNGRYRVDLQQGVYSVSIIHSDYSTQTLNDIRIASGQSVEQNIELTPAGLELAEYVVIVPYIEGSVASAVADVRQSDSVIDVIGADQMSAAGDSDAADALARVSGLTLQDGRYVVIRGLESRYTASLWNGSELPSPNPARRIVPLDLFPTSTLKAVEVRKTYSPNLPGTFGGGLVDLETRGVPEEGFLELGLSSGLNTQSTGSEGLTYKGGNGDRWASDDGTRAIPGAIEAATPKEGRPQVSSAEMAQLGTEFPNTYQVDSKTLPPGYGLDVAGGRRFQRGSDTYGFSASFNYSDSWSKQEGPEREYSLSAGELKVTDDLTRTETVRDIGLGGMVTLGAEWGANHSLTGNLFHIRQATDRVERKFGDVQGSQNSYEDRYLLEWVEQELNVQQLLGHHAFPGLAGLQLDWNATTARGRREAPDRRFYLYAGDGAEDLRFQQRGLYREYAELDDDTTSHGVDLTLPLSEGSAWPTSLKTGISNLEKERSAGRRTFKLDGFLTDYTDPNPEDILAPEHIEAGTPQYQDVTQFSDYYNGRQSQSGTYLMFDTTWRERLRLTGGVRQERADLAVTTRIVAGGGTEARTAAVSAKDDLNALAATWYLSDTAQLRLAYGQTISLPDLAEISPGYFEDPESGDFLLGAGNADGSVDLERTLIDNYDLRWEWYPSTTESITLAWFHKAFTNPIERIYVPAFRPVLSFQNGESAEVSGVEAGGRKGLGFLGTFLEDAYVSGNVTLLESSIRLDTETARINTNPERPLQGQADRLLNLELGYEGERHRFAANFNLVGKRIVEVGTKASPTATVGRPDVYAEPVPILNLIYRWRVTEDLGLKASLKNALDPNVEYTQGSEVKESFKRGRDFGVSLSYRF